MEISHERISQTLLKETRMNSVAQWLVFWQVAPFAVVALCALAVWAYGVHEAAKHWRKEADKELARYVRRSGR